MHSNADMIREKARVAYVLPAMARREQVLSIVVGDLARAMGLQSRVPAVCAALQSKAFLTQNNLTLESKVGPPSGQGTRVTLTYRLASAVSEPTRDRFLSLRGALRGLGVVESVKRGRGEFESK